MWCAGRVRVRSEHALILNRLIKWACQVGVCPISACTGPSKRHIAPIDVPLPPPRLNKKQWKSLTHIVLLFMDSENGSFRVDFSSSHWLFPAITDLASFHMYSRKLTVIQLLLLSAHSLKCIAPQLFPSMGGYLRWLQLQKTFRKKGA